MPACFIPLRLRPRAANSSSRPTRGHLNVFGHHTIAIETEGEHAAQGGAIAHSVSGKRMVNFTSGQGIVYGVEQYYHAPGKGSHHGA